MTSSRNIGHLLSQIKKSERFEHRTDPSQADERQRPTSLGSPLLRSGEGRFRVDLSGVLVLSGLADLVSTLAERFMEQHRAEDADQLVLHPVSPSATPELASLGVRRIALHARRKVAGLLVRNAGFLTRQLRRVLGALHNSAIREDLFRSTTAPGEGPHGRLFPLEAGGEFPEGFVLLEYEPDGAFLRILFELEEDQRLYLKRIPHRVVTQKESMLFEQDTDSLADQMALGLNQAGRSQREVHEETPDRLPAWFASLRAAGLEGLGLMRFTWQGQDGLPEARSTEWMRLLARMLLLLQEESAVRLLADGCEIELASGARTVFLDMSRRGACLNISLGRRRQRADLRGYLRRLPRLERLAVESKGVLEGVRVVFIHHFTAETLGVIAALREMGCAHLHGLFIRYKSILPDAFLEALLALPEQQFVFHSLTQVENEAQLMGRYLLSREFSPVAPLASLDEELRRTPLDYFKAMRAAACHVVMRQLLEARRAGQRVLLIEDGGYAAPVFNRWTAEKITLEEALRRSYLKADEGNESSQLFGDWLAGLLVAGVEHTRNGYDQLMEVRRQCGEPVYPSYTIALSDYKNTEEAFGAAMAILMAAEYILAGRGDSLHQRHALVIGSQGFIGRHLLAQLAARSGAERVIGVDRAAKAMPSEYPELSVVPADALARLDLIVGITGHPVFTAEALSHILLKGSSRRIYLVSGSTKNVEFAQVMEWLQNLRHREDAHLGEYPVRLEAMALRDPLTEIAQGSMVRIHFERGLLPEGVPPEEPWKDVVLAADGMPLNFNFFGVPGEIMDRVMEQLLILCRLAVKSQAGNTDLHVLDYTINEAGQPIQGRVLP